MPVTSTGIELKEERDAFKTSMRRACANASEFTSMPRGNILQPFDMFSASKKHHGRCRKRNGAGDTSLCRLSIAF